jgi:hypothetical protein
MGVGGVGVGWARQPAESSSHPVHAAPIHGAAAGRGNTGLLIHKALRELEADPS